MRLRLHAAGVETEVPFESWLQGAEPLRATASVSTPVTQSGAGPRIQIAGPVQITFQPNWDLRFQGAGAVNLTGLGGATTSDTLRIALLDGDAPGLMLAPEAIRSLISIRNSGTAWHDWTALRTLAGGRLTWRRNPFDAILLEAAEHPGGRRTRALLATAAANQDVMLDAEDLVRGYCVDVWHSATKSWHPLCRRVGTYDFLTAGETLVIEDEGWVSTAVSSASDGSSDDLYVQEQLFRWRGWSLVAPRPGLTIDKDGLAADIQNTPPYEFQLPTDFKAAPGSLPRLRYGDSYRLRARAVDLAGNSAPFGDPRSDDFSLATAPVVFGRFEPVANPALVRRSPRIEGDSMERMVIRSNFNTTAADVDERHVAPQNRPTHRRNGRPFRLVERPRQGRLCRNHRPRGRRLPRRRDHR
jgi:hypothetical protein